MSNLLFLDSKEWIFWNKYPARARVWFIKGGPGQGKSTIGQYFCQIQRAALILQKDVLRTSTKQKELASRIRKVAEKSGFWPLAPRIPISIELKEFAQWFGQRDKNEARGILTYLGECIAAGVEQKVTVGTLKRMLESRSWLIVFDGLDEVPHDVKDAVAAEICHFVNDIALDVNADLLTLCTSRPQGYSGQFANLDGPTIELVSLTPKQALACAKPLLELGRTQVEARRSFQILESAIESPAVCELMTTPLQAHIMAVVVRDGQRPPERKWKLFTNFYHVIRKREANKNSPDKKLARLLREQEQLLKTVHNRLGFVLHAQAESSKGAQTRLDRTGFKKLVTDAVVQMVETEVDETIEILMEATTDRLVLVSTPDDGNHVRFDIRPLQEFFAAEFLYESVKVEELRQRIELIAGDAHWREVMHFLMSALVENDRQTELIVAIEVLESLNEGEEDNLRLLKRRLGRGAILAARLIQEGVLEEDRRTRQQFRKCLEPLTASTELELLQVLIQVNQPNSKSWLYNFLVFSLQENKLTENVGAAVALTKILPDENPLVEEVSKILLSSSPAYLSCIYNLSLPRRYFDKLLARSSTIKDWFLKLTLEVLSSSQWLLLTDEAFRAAIEIIRLNPKKTISIAKELDFPSIQINLLKKFSQEKTYNLIEANYGIVRISYRVGSQSASDFDPSTLEGLSSSSFFKLVYLVYHFNQTRSHSDLFLFLNNLGKKATYLFDILSFHLGTYISLSRDIPLADQFQYLASIGQEEFSLLLSNKQPFNNKQIGLPLSHQTRFIETVGFSTEYDSKKWVNLVTDHPDLALYVWAEEESFKKITETEQAKVVNSLICRALKLPHLLIQNPSVWGKLLKAPSKYERKLRQTLVELSSSIKLKEVQPFNFSTSEFNPFKLNLPLEAPLLPYLIVALLESTEKPYRHKESSQELESINGVILEMVNDSSDLRQIVNNSNLDKDIRAAAIIMLLLHPEGKTLLVDVQQLVVGFYTSEIDAWYIKVITICLSLLTTEEDSAARWIISNLLSATRMDYGSRQYLQTLLASWRESSYAPIQKANVQEKWLSSK